MKLSNLQRRLLAGAAARSDGHLFPSGGTTVAKSRESACESLLAMELVVAAPVAADDRLWRQQGETKLGLVITAQGRDLIAAEQDGVSMSELPTPAEAKPSTSKIGKVLALLVREEGATLDEIGQTTDWLPHSVRAALTGLRKKGHAVSRDQRDGITTYRIVQEG